MGENVMSEPEECVVLQGGGGGGASSDTGAGSVRDAEVDGACDADTCRSLQNAHLCFLPIQLRTSYYVTPHLDV
ncbi:unnamed protein product [Urochloa humidicola]